MSKTIFDHPLFKLANSNFRILNESNRVSNPLVSIVVNTYNHSEYIHDCLKGVAQQKCDFPVECLIGDDCSSDGTISIIQDYIRMYPSVFCCIFRTVRLGQYTGNGRFNFVHTLSLARGEYIAICEGDDFWHNPYKLQKQVDYLISNSQSSISTHVSNIIYDDRDKKRSADYIGNNFMQIITGDDLFDANDERSPKVIPYHISSWLFRRNILYAIPESSYKVRSLDNALFVEILQHGHCFCIPECMSTYRVNSSSSWSPLDTRVRSIAYVHYLYLMASNYKHLKKRILGCLRKEYLIWLRWPIRRVEMTSVVKEVIHYTKLDFVNSLSLIAFVFTALIRRSFHQFCSSIIIELGRYKRILFRQ